MLHLTISLRAIVFVLLLCSVALTGSDVAYSAPSMANLTADTLIRFQTTGQDVAHDINVDDNKGGLRFYGCPTLTTTPQCAAIQFFGDGSSGFPGQLYIDSGSSSTAAIIFRTPNALGAITQRMSISKSGRVSVGTPVHPSCLNISGMLCANHLVAETNISAGDRVLAGDVDHTGCNSAGDICAGDDLIAHGGVSVIGNIETDNTVSAGRIVKAGFVTNSCTNTGNLCAGRDLIVDEHAGIKTGPHAFQPLNVFGDVRIGTDTTGCVLDRDDTVIAGTCSSDVRMKKDIDPFGPALSQLAALQPVYFSWRTDTFPERGFGSGRSFGLIAQDVESIIPELVIEDDYGYKAVRYNLIPLLMLQGLRELKSENDALREQNASLEARLAAIEQRLNGGTTPLVAVR
jgi:hypothetical protein